MKVEVSPQVRQEYRKSTAPTAPSKTFGQVLEARAQDRYVPSTPLPRTEAEFSAGNRIYHGNVPVSNATHAKLKHLAELNAQADYTGMSPEEILSEIWNRYDEAFDGNMVAITGCIAGPAEWCEVNNQFIGEINQHICHPEKRAAYKEAEIANASASGTKIDPEKYGEERADTYCAMLGVQFDEAFNPNSVYNVGHEKCALMTADQWYRVANQPFDADKFAVAMKEHLGTISGPNNYSADIVKMMENFFDHFVTGAVEDSLGQLLGEAKE